MTREENKCFDPLSKAVKEGRVQIPGRKSRGIR
jgi:hypothetical protein